MSKRKKWQDRKERLERRRSENAKSRRRMIGVAVGVAIIALAAGMVYMAMAADRDEEGYEPASGTQNYSNDKFVSIPLSETGTTAKFYTYDAGGTTVRFFIVQDSESRPQLAVDASDVCYKAKKSFRQINACCMGCNNCDKVVHINNLGTPNTGGGCWPSVIPIKVENGSVVINKSDLDAKVYLFS